MVFYIYKIKDINYIGSTKNIKERTYRHRSNINNKKSSTYNLLLYQFCREKNKKIELEILGVYKKKCSIRLRSLVEQYYINKYDSINNGYNCNQAFCSNKQRLEYDKKYYKNYYSKNKYKILEYNKKYYEKYYPKNKNRINQKNKIKINCCLCGSLVRKDGLKRHHKSNKCLKSIKIKTTKDKYEIVV